MQGNDVHKRLWHPLTLLNVLQTVNSLALVLYQVSLLVNMVRSFTLAAAAALLSAPLVSSHYILNIRKPPPISLKYKPSLNILIVMHNGKQVGGEYTYVRKNSNSYMPSFMEIIDSLVFLHNKNNFL